MHIIFDGIAIVVAAGTVATIIALLVHGRIATTTVNDCRDHIVLVVGVAGTLFAIVIGMMAVQAWGALSTASGTAAAEASAVDNLAWFAHSMPQQDAGRMTALLGTYADQVIHDDWPAMISRHTLSPQTGTTLDAIGYTFSLYQPQNFGQLVRYQAAQTDLQAIYADRIQRQQESSSAVPPILWLGLFVTGIVVLSAPVLFGSLHKVAHALLSFVTAGVMAYALFMIAEVNHPFAGDISVTPKAFAATQQHIQELNALWTSAMDDQPSVATSTARPAHSG
jgi:hypothetical protein